MKKLFAVMAAVVVAMSMSSFAAEVDISGGTAFGVSELYRSVVRIATVDTSVNEAGAGDTFYVMNIPSNTSVEQVFVEVTDADTAASTISVGDSDSATRYLSSCTLTNTHLAASAFSAAITQTAVSSNAVWVSAVGADGAQTKMTNEIVYLGATNDVLTNTIVYISAIAASSASTIVTNPVVRSITAGTSAVTDKGKVYTAGDKIVVTFATASAAAKFNVIAILNKLDK